MYHLSLSPSVCQGYCDVFQKCREVNPSGPLATLRKILLSEESIASLGRFLVRHWYLAIFVALGVLPLMVSCIAVFFFFWEGRGLFTVMSNFFLGKDCHSSTSSSSCS